MISHLIRSALDKDSRVFYLHSSMTDHPSSSCSYLAIGVESEISAIGDRIRITNKQGFGEFKDNPWDALQKFRKRAGSEWLFGYLGYDLKNYLEDLKSENNDLIGLPDLYFFVPEIIVRIDAENKIEWLKGESASITHPGADYSPIELILRHQISDQEYKSAVEKAKLYIHEGDFYEINLSHQQVYDFKGDAYSLYEQMVQNGPVPFGAFINLNGMQVSCLSPERFLKKTGSEVLSQPIKGTRERSSLADLKSEIEDLRNSEKDRAENLMIVDLVRNDLSRVAMPGSVKVDELFEIQSFGTVHQMVSTVKAIVDPSVEVIDIIKACFPMGSMTGAPKIASMKIIEELEQHKRGLYSGAIGYIKADGDFDFNVVIRTAITKDERLFYATGGAITSDSDADAEWKETQTKVRALTDIAKSPIQ